MGYAWRSGRLARPGDAVLRAAGHGLDLADQIVDRFVGAGGIELRGLDHQKRAGRVMEEEVLVGLVQFLEVPIARDRDVGFGTPGAVAQPAREHVGRGLQVDHQVGSQDVAREKVVQALVDKELVVVEIEKRVDPIFVEDVVADGDLAEQVRLAQ